MITLIVKEYANLWKIEFYTNEGRLFKTKEISTIDLRDYIGLIRRFYSVFDVTIKKVIYEHYSSDLLHLSQTPST